MNKLDIRSYALFTAKNKIYNTIFYPSIELVVYNNRYVELQKFITALEGSIVTTKFLNVNVRIGLFFVSTFFNIKLFFIRSCFYVFFLSFLTFQKKTKNKVEKMFDTKNKKMSSERKRRCDKETPIKQSYEPVSPFLAGVNKIADAVETTHSVLEDEMWQLKANLSSGVALDSLMEQVLYMYTCIYYIDEYMIHVLAYTTQHGIINNK
ncbi:hypothetical protein RFI_20247 [Reticulomyxa filosa]|uniref:Uncharacterized protein n=1 Tax=Reticulomyxa filosa TaxID=46433 RepID=X6MTB5_RETFI|nr:hypothetical protein RFI_20247 [Reticulomyxa filosa]|eukprot:ETO17089.1 hypothetical protein RFI_20247 [Reticulomyxa filosa]